MVVPSTRLAGRLVHPSVLPAVHEYQNSPEMGMYKLTNSGHWSPSDKLKDMWADNEACLQHMVRNKKQVIYKPKGDTKELLNKKAKQRCHVTTS